MVGASPWRLLSRAVRLGDFGIDYEMSPLFQIVSQKRVRKKNVVFDMAESLRNQSPPSFGR
jgi:hypothetical protein